MYALEIALGIFYFLFFCFLIYKTSFFNICDINKNWFISIFSLKIIFGIVLTLIYTYYYTDQSNSDIYKYFNDSAIMYEAVKSNPFDYFKMLLGLDFDSLYFDNNYYRKMDYWHRSSSNSNLLSDTHTIIRFNAFARIFSMGSIYIHTIFINFISLIGLIALFKAFKPHFPSSHQRTLFYVIFLIPSVLFWGSGLLKESILFFALGLFITHFFKLTKVVRTSSLLILFIACLLILFTKLYILIALIPACLGYLIHQKVIKKKPFTSYLSSFGIIFLITLLFNYFFERLNPFILLIKKQRDFLLEMKMHNHINTIEILPFESTIDVILYIPLAIYNTISSPHLNNSNSILTLMSAMENLIFIILLLSPVFYFKRKQKNIPILLFCFSFAIPLLIIIGSTTPIIGAIVRYRTPALIFIAIGIITLVDFEKIKNRSAFLNKML